MCVFSRTKRIMFSLLKNNIANLLSLISSKNNCHSQRLSYW